MARVQVVVKQSARHWDAIRETKEGALMRIGAYMMESESTFLQRVGASLRYEVQMERDGIQMLETMGFTVTVKELT